MSHTIRLLGPWELQRLQQADTDVDKAAFATQPLGSRRVRIPLSSDGFADAIGQLDDQESQKPIRIRLLRTFKWPHESSTESIRIRIDASFPIERCWVNETPIVIRDNLSDSITSTLNLQNQLCMESTLTLEEMPQVSGVTLVIAENE